MQILLIGCGNMGSAMLSAWLTSGLVTRAVVLDHKDEAIAARFATYKNILTTCANVKSLPPDLAPNLVVLAVKPQQMAGTLAELAPILKPEWPVMTIAAGLRHDFYTQHLPGRILIRAMPNTPAMIGEGMTVATAHGLPPVLRQAIENLLRATGDFLWLDNEDQLDAATAVSGSGIAYFLYLAEQMTKSGIAQGLTPEQAERLARQTLIGTGAIAAAQPDKTLAELKQTVISPGGVTEATLAAWDKNNTFQNLVALGVRANMRRSQELAKNNA